MTLSLPRRLQVIVLGAVLALFATLGALQLAGGSGSPAVAPTDVARSAAGAALGKLPLMFVENRGQVDERAGLYVSGSDTSVFFTGDGLRMWLNDDGLARKRYGLGLDFVGARAGAEPVGRRRTPALMSYFKGARADWRTGVPTYSEVAYTNLWPGVDLVYSGTGSRLKYSFLVKPGADPAAIQLAWQGATGLGVNAQGQLEVSTPAGVVRDDAPVSYQVVDGRRAKVDSSYALASGHRYGFRLGSYDRSKPLVIDPAVLVYAGFIGGSGDETINNVALDGSRNLYVTGTTTSPDFPAVVGPDTSFGRGLNDGFVAKVRADGSSLVYAGYIGGSDFDNPINIAVDGARAAYVSGSTGSSQSEGFPVKTGPDLTYNGGPQDAFVVKVNPTGSGLDYAGYIGGAGGPGDSPADPNEQANGIDVDAAGAAYLAGFTKSDQTTFPDGDGIGAVPGFDTTFNSFVPPIPGAAGPPDAWVAKVKSNGTGLDYATYVGGGGADAGTGVVVDAAGNAHVNIFTGSKEGAIAAPPEFGGFPDGDGFGAIPGFDQTYNGPPGPEPNDAGAVKLNAAGTSLLYATYLGGAGTEQPFGNVLDGAGNVYITGRTDSDGATFPDGDGFGAIPGFDKVLNAGPAAPAAQDAFVVKLNTAGSALAYATYVGGSGEEFPIGIALDSAGSAHIAGSTASTQATFPATGGPDSTYNGGPSDAFVAKLNPPGTGLAYAGYIGGALDDDGLGMAVDGAGNAYTAGSTDSDQCSGFPVAVGPDLTFNGSFGSLQAFVAKVDPTGTAAGPRLSPPPGCPRAAALPAFRGCSGRTSNVIRGTTRADRLTGTPRGDRIFAAAGNDRVVARGGGDCVDLGAGADRARGDSGGDLIVGRSGRDRINGGSGNDRITGGSANDRISGSRGRDRINGGSGRDRISADSSTDRVSGAGGGDRINGNSGNDRLSGNSGNDRIRGGSGRDRIVGGRGNDRIHARDNRRDRISCGRGRDRVVADAVDRVARDCETVRSTGANAAGIAALQGGAIGLLGGAGLLLVRRRRSSDAFAS